jgi:hypothetical protein
VIFVSALKYHVLPDSWTNFYRPLWLLSGVLNSLYSFYWDVTRDWDLRYDDCYCTVSQLQSEKLLASDLQIRLLENAITIGLTY